MVYLASILDFPRHRNWVLVLIKFMLIRIRKCVIALQSVLNVVIDIAVHFFREPLSVAFRVR